jgi:3-hydroxyacyl-CoA dehydrogenase
VYEAGSRQGKEDAEVLAIVEAERQRAGITPRAFSTEELERRYIAAMVNEAAKVVAEGIALRPLDVDVTLLYGYGFPRHKGGPLHHADQLGLATVLADIQRLAEEDPLFWQPAPLLVKLVAEGRNFASLN